MINVVSIGSRGDIQPYAVLTQALQNAGHAVRLLAPHDFGDLLAPFNIDYVPVGGSVQVLMESDEGKALMKTRNPVSLAKGMFMLAGPMAEKSADATLALSADADVIITAAPSAWLVHSVAEHLEIPMIMTYLQPLMPASEYFSCITPQPPIRLPGSINRFSTWASYTGFWNVIRPVVNRLRREKFDLPAMPRLGSEKPFYESKEPVLMAISEHVVPHSADWHENVHLTGYWTYDNAENYQPSAELTAFLAAGAPPVYIGFGSMQNDDPAATTAIILEALALCGQRGVILTGWGGLDAADLPPTVFKLAHTSHDWLFPQMAAIVHHGGAGTTAAALRSGRPSIVVPFFADQPFWGQRVHALGVGPQPLPRRKLSAEALAAAIMTAIDTPEIVAAAATLGDKLQAENGAQRAVEVIETLLAKN